MPLTLASTPMRKLPGEVREQFEVLFHLAEVGLDSTSVPQGPKLPADAIFASHLTVEILAFQMCTVASGL